MLKILQVLYRFSMYIFKILFRIITIAVPVYKKEVIFMAFHGRGIIDNPKAIYLEMISERRFDGYSIIWIVNDKNVYIPKGKVATYQSISYFFHLMRSKYWIINCKLPEYVYKKKQQIYIQTWHGTPLKRLGMDIVDSERRDRSGKNMKSIGESYKIDAKRYNYMISPNPFSSKVFQSAFGVKKDKLVEMGYPRNDVLYNASVELKFDLKKKYQIPLEKKVILYAPTWRDNDYDIAGYTLHLQSDFLRWKELLTEYIVLLKPHYFIVNEIEVPEEVRDFVWIMSPRCDINDLYLMSDCLVTDYSSVFFDYALLKRPIYFYMYDLEQYKEKLRGFYLDVFTELPGDIYIDEKELLVAINTGKYDYVRLDSFNRQFNCFQTNNSSKSLLDLVWKDQIGD